MVLCERCNTRMIMRPHEITASIPPKRIYDCPCCGNVQYSTQDDDKQVIAEHSPLIKYKKIVPVDLDNDLDNNLDNNLDKYDWPNLRMKISVWVFKRIMSTGSLVDPQIVASKSVEYADALIKKLNDNNSLLPSNIVRTNTEEKNYVLINERDKQ